MVTDNTKPSELTFWKKCLADHSLLMALKKYPEEAVKIFGVGPVMRGNVIELGMILGAREILAVPPGRLTVDTNTVFERELSAALDELPAEAQAVAREFLGAKNHENIVREVARKMIKDATGIEPCP